MPGTEHIPPQKNLVAIAYGRPLENDKYRKYLRSDPRSVLTKGGSVNIPMMSLAIALAGGSRVEQQLAAEWWQEFFLVSRQMFMGRELMSRTYGLWHLISVLFVHAYGPLSLRAESRAWIQCFLTLLWGTSDSTGRTCFGGMRSAGHPLSHDAFEWVLAVAMRANPSRWEKGWKNEWTYGVLKRLQDNLHDATEVWSKTLHKEIFTTGFFPMVEVNIRKGTKAAIWWIKKNLHGSTPPWLAGKIEDGKPGYIMPLGGGKRIRGQFDDACTEKNGPATSPWISYYGDLYDSGNVPFPEDVTIYKLAWAPSTAVVRVEPPRPLDPPEEDDDDTGAEAQHKLSALERIRNFFGRIYALLSGRL